MWLWAGDCVEAVTRKADGRGVPDTEDRLESKDVRTVSTSEGKEGVVAAGTE